MSNLIRLNINDMEHFKMMAISRQDTPEVAYVIEGEDMFYYVDTSPMCGDYGYVYPSTERKFAGRFRYDWNKKVNNLEVPYEVIRCIVHAKSDPIFQDACTVAKQKLGAKKQ